MADITSCSSWHVSSNCIWRLCSEFIKQNIAHWLQSASDYVSLKMNGIVRVVGQDWCKMKVTLPSCLFNSSWFSFWGKVEYKHYFQSVHMLQCIFLVRCVRAVWSERVSFMLQMSGVVSEGVINVGSEGDVGCKWQWNERNWIQEPCLKQSLFMQVMFAVAFNVVCKPLIAGDEPLCEFWCAICCYSCVSDML